MAQIKETVRIDGQKAQLVVRKQYEENGFKYGYVRYQGEEYEVCRDTTIRNPNGTTTYEWSNVR